MPSPHKIAGRTFLLGAVAALAACSTMPSRHAEAPPLPDTWEDTGAQVEARALTDWWTAFDDPLLNQLVAEGLSEGPSAQIALLRVKQALALNRQTLSDFLPLVSGKAGGSYTKVEDGPNLVGSFQSFVTGGGGGQIVQEKEQFIGSYGPQVSWQIPLFGRIEATAIGSRAALASNKADLHGARATLSADIAQAYVDFRAEQQRVAALEEAAALAVRLADITDISAKAGLVAPADAADVRRLAESTKARVPDAILSARRAAATLSTLRGRAPGTEPDDIRARLAAAGKIPVYPQMGAPAAPADLLRQRPDIAAAEADAIVAAARVGVARQDLLPQIQLTGSLDITDNIIGSGVPERLAQVNATPALSVPLFGWGRRFAAIRGQQAQFDQALISYESTVNLAVAEASLALASLKQGEARLAAAEAAETAAEMTARGIRASNDVGIASLADRLRAEQQLIDARTVRVAAAQAQASAAIQVFRAFGGGPPELSRKQLNQALRGSQP